MAPDTLIALLIALAIGASGRAAATEEDPFATIRALEAEQAELLERLNIDPDAVRAAPPTSPADARMIEPAADDRVPGALLRGRVAYARLGRFYLLDLAELRRREYPGMPANPYEPSFSPDGRRVVLGDGRLHLLELDSGEVRPLIDGPKFPNFHPRQNRLVYGVPGRGLFVHDLDRDEIKRLLDNSLMPFQPAWHPDGERIVFVGQHPDSASRHLFVMDTRCLGREDCAPTPRQIVHDGRFNHAPAWSPDGRWIAFSRMPTDDGDWTVALVDPDSGRLHRVTRPGAREHRPVWLPDSRHLIVLREDPRQSGLANLHLVDLDGRTLMQLTTEGAHSPAYHPGP
jgi:Tol biopolymer transport system component